MPRTGFRIFCLLGLALAAERLRRRRRLPDQCSGENPCLRPGPTARRLRKPRPLLQDISKPGDCGSGRCNSRDHGRSLRRRRSDRRTHRQFLRRRRSTPEPTIQSLRHRHPSDGYIHRPACDDAQFLDDVTIPDGTVLKPGEEFKKTWRMKNTGVCTWTTEYAIGFAYGEQMHGSETKLPNSVSPGAFVDITVNLRAPIV